jgi:TolB-like protein/DNA-binding winged helix-turn-helix (wHTH) protein/Tfp pilus assembly protein PilF
MPVPAKQFYDFAPFRLDVTEGVLLRDGKTVSITPKAFELLRVLVENHGHILSKEDLLRQVWPETFVEEGNLSFNISQLRKALGQKENGVTYIETIPKRGYRFAAPVTVVNGGGLPAAVAAKAAPAPLQEVLPEESAAVGMRQLRVPIQRRPLVLALVVLVALLLAVNLGGLRKRLPWGQPSIARIQSIAVLPLEDVSHDPNQEYFADGMTDQLIMELGRIGALRVISRTSAMAYKGVRKPLAQIARELRVDAAVEGTVLRSGDRVRISAQLIRVNPEGHLWARTYEREWRDALVLQEDVAHAIAREIRVNLTPQERARLSSARPVDPQAQDAYLRGVYFWNKRTEKDLERSIEYFDRAIERDPGYALSYTGLANGYSSLGLYGHLPPREAFPKAHVAALRALELDDNLAEAHAVLGFYKALYEWDEPGADREFRRAIELNPGCTFAHIWRGEVLSDLERPTEALAELDRAHELDPTSLMASDQRGWVLYTARRYDEAIAQIRRTIELEPRFAHAHCWLGKTYLQKRMLREGLAELEEAVSLPGGDSQLYTHWLGYAYALSGKRAAAYKVIEGMRSQAQKNFVSPTAIATIYCGLGEKNQALAWLEKAYQEHDPLLINVKNEPALDSLRSDERFQELVRRIHPP